MWPLDGRHTLRNSLSFRKYTFGTHSATWASKWGCVSGHLRNANAMFRHSFCFMLLVLFWSPPTCEKIYGFLAPVRLTAKKHPMKDKQAKTVFLYVLASSGAKIWRESIIRDAYKRKQTPEIMRNISVSVHEGFPEYIDVKLVAMPHSSKHRDLLQPCMFIVFWGFFIWPGHLIRTTVPGQRRPKVK